MIAKTTRMMQSPLLSLHTHDSSRTASLACGAHSPTQLVVCGHSFESLVVIASLGSLASFFVASLLHGALFTLVVVLGQFVYMLPTFINMFTIFSLSNTHDVSWATKEGKYWLRQHTNACLRHLRADAWLTLNHRESGESIYSVRAQREPRQQRQQGTASIACRD